jgi:ribosomal protein S19E (S16A)
MSVVRAERERRLRGEILRLLRECHENQQSAYDDVVLAGVLDRLHFDVSVNLVRALLQDLKERGLVKYVQEKDRVTGKISIREIKILPRGRDVLDQTVEDKSVELIG